MTTTIIPPTADTSTATTINNTSISYYIWYHYLSLFIITIIRHNIINLIHQPRRTQRDVRHHSRHRLRHLHGRAGIRIL
jgi:hypothetical protein